MRHRRQNPHWLWMFSALILLSLATAHAQTAPTWTVNNLVPVKDGTDRLLWQRSDNAVEVWKLDAQGNYVSTTPVYGPYANWRAEFLTPNLTDSTTYLLWRGVDSNGTDNGSLVIWKFDSSGNYASSSPVFGPYGGWQEGDLTPERNGTFHLTWLAASAQGVPTGGFVTWTLNSSLQYVSASNVLGPVAGWSNYKGLTEGVSGDEHVFWSAIGPDGYTPTGQAVIWNLDSQGNYASSSKVFGPVPGWSNYDFFLPKTKGDGGQIFWSAVASDGYTPLGQYVIWNLDAQGNYVSSSPTYGPLGSWRTYGLTPNFIDDTLQVFWNTVGSDGNTPTGQYVIWNLDAQGNYVSSSSTFGPIGSWRVYGLSPRFTDKTKQLLWHNVAADGYSDTGQYVIWNLDAQGNYVSSSPVYGPF